VDDDAAVADQPLSGRTIGVTADRRWQEQQRLFRARGAEVVHGPTMVTVDLTADAALRAATTSLLEAPPDYLVATTGLGMRMWLEAAASWGVGDDLTASLGRARIVARGAKAASAVRGAGFDVWWRAPEERMDQVVARLAEEDLQGARVAVQLFEPADHPSTAALTVQAGTLVEVPVYRWLLPDDPQPAQRLVELAVTGGLDAVTFTSQPAVRHLFRIAESVARADALREAFADGLVAACVGPVCAEAAREEGIRHPVWPEPNRLTMLVRQVTELLGRPA
jgi:uroporphyrinogen-III synthase